MTWQSSRELGFAAAGDVVEIGGTVVGAGVTARAVGPVLRASSDDFGRFLLRVAREVHRDERGCLDPGLGLRPGRFQFRDWRVGEAYDKVLPDGSYPSWRTIRGRYWKTRLAWAAPGEFASANVGRMRRGKGPMVRVLVRYRGDGRSRIKLVTKELHHHRRNRGRPGYDSPLDLREVWPWEHEKIDVASFTDYDFIDFWSD
jgi:hypothetical protein